MFAKGLRSKRTSRIGVVLPKSSHIYFPDVLQAIEDGAEEKNYSVMYFSSNYSFKQEKKHISFLRSNWVDGIIIDSCCPEEETEKYISFLTSEKDVEKRIPIVSFDTILASDQISSVGIDNRRGTRMAVEHLIKLGHRRIAFIGGPDRLAICRDNYRGYCEALQAQGIEKIDELIYHGDYMAVSGYEITRQMLAEKKEFTAIAAANDQMALGAIHALKKNGYSVPQDAAVAGFDNVFIGTLVEPPLTTVSVPRYEIGRKAVDLLIRQIEGRQPAAENIILDCELVVRGSTDSRAESEWELHGW